MLLLIFSVKLVHPVVSILVVLYRAFHLVQSSGSMFVRHGWCVLTIRLHVVHSSVPFNLE